MTKHVPTTGVIRVAYQIARDSEDNLVSFNEFHSWLEQHNAEIIAKAEERIIKLLEEHEAISDGSEGGNPAVCTCQQWSLTSESYEDHIKRLIKGEK